MASIKFWVMCAFQCNWMLAISYMRLAPGTRQSPQGSLQEWFSFVQWSWLVTLQNTLLVTGKRIRFCSASLDWGCTVSNGPGLKTQREFLSPCPLGILKSAGEKQTWKQTMTAQGDKLWTSCSGSTDKGWLTVWGFSGELGKFSPNSVIEWGFEGWVKVCWASLIAQLVKNPPAMQETPGRLLGQEDPLEKG